MLPVCPVMKKFNEVLLQLIFLRHGCGLALWPAVPFGRGQRGPRRCTNGKSRSLLYNWVTDWRTIWLTNAFISSFADLHIHTPCFQDVSLWLILPSCLFLLALPTDIPHFPRVTNYAVRLYEPSWSASEWNASNTHSYRRWIQPHSTAGLQFKV